VLTYPGSESSLPISVFTCATFFGVVVTTTRGSGASRRQNITLSQTSCAVFFDHAAYSSIQTPSNA
jgi:hypothetical protein